MIMSSMQPVIALLVNSIVVSGKEKED